MEREELENIEEVGQDATGTTIRSGYSPEKISFEPRDFDTFAPVAKLLIARGHDSALLSLQIFLNQFPISSDLSHYNNSQLIAHADTRTLLKTRDKLTDALIDPLPAIVRALVSMGHELELAQRVHARMEHEARLDRQDAEHAPESIDDVSQTECPTCGGAILNTAKFCTQCGSQLRALNALSERRRIELEMRNEAMPEGTLGRWARREAERLMRINRPHSEISAYLENWLDDFKITNVMPDRSKMTFVDALETDLDIHGVIRQVLGWEPSDINAWQAEKEAERVAAREALSQRCGVDVKDGMSNIDIMRERFREDLLANDYTDEDINAMQSVNGILSCIRTKKQAPP